MSSGTTQKNGVVVFAPIYIWMCTIMMYMGIHENLKNGLWTKCAANISKLKKISLWTLTEKNVTMTSSMERFQTTKNI